MFGTTFGTVFTVMWHPRPTAQENKSEDTATWLQGWLSQGVLRVSMVRTSLVFSGYSLPLLRDPSKLSHRNFVGRFTRLRRWAHPTSSARCERARCKNDGWWPTVKLPKTTCRWLWPTKGCYTWLQDARSLKLEKRKLENAQFGR